MSLILNSPHIYLTPALDEAQNRAGGDGTKLPSARQADLQRRHGEDWLDVVRNYFNIRNIPGLQAYYDFQTNVDQIACPTLTIATETPGDTFDHALEIKRRVATAHLAIQPTYVSSATSGYGQESAEDICRLVLNFTANLQAVGVNA